MSRGSFDGEDDIAERSDSSAASESEDEDVDLMITNRERRKTAGNRYSQVVAYEQADEDDDVALLFAEAEGEDEEYNSDEADDEAEMSSSDDDDQGPDTGAEDLEGEQEIQKEAKAERAKKRKADMALTSTSGIRKKPKIDPTSLHRAPVKAKPTKRKDRVSWLPTDSDAPGRTSMRKQTVAHRHSMIERLKENEEQRLKNKAVRDEKEKERQAAAPRELTQADRLLEAERNERRNAKSLNRWEAMEAKRAEEQAARLAALKDRRVDGPVLTFYSSAHTYRGPKVSVLDAGTDPANVKKRGRKPKILPEICAPKVGTPPISPAVPLVPGVLSVATMTSSPAVPPGTGSNLLDGQIQCQLTGESSRVALKDSSPTRSESKDEPQQSNPAAPDEQSLAQVQGISVSAGSKPASSDSAGNDSPSKEHLADEADVTRTNGSSLPSVTPTLDNATLTRQDAIVQDPSQPTDRQPALDPSRQGDLKPMVPFPTTLDPPTSVPKLQQLQQASTVITKPTDDPHPVPFQVSHATPPTKAETIQPSDTITANLDNVSNTPDAEDASNSVGPVEDVVSTRNLVVLQGFEGLTAAAKQAYSVFYNTRKTPKPPKHVPEQCPITSLNARYRDPATGVGYATVGAYKKLQDLQHHRYIWSSMLGCYVGRQGHVARGVPQGFLP